MRAAPLLEEHPAGLQFILAGVIPALYGAHGATTKADLPEPAILLVLATALLGIAFGAIGGYLRARSQRGVARA